MPFKYMAVDDGYEIDPKTGMVIPFETLTEGEDNENKDEIACAKNTGTGKKALRRKVKDRV